MRTQTLKPMNLRKILIEKAKQGQKITYGDLNTLFGQPRNEMYPLLNIIYSVEKAEQETYPDGPMLSAVVVNEKTGYCGEGFHKLAREFGYRFQNEFEFEDDQRKQLQAVYSQGTK